MSNIDRSVQLSRIVESAIEEHGLDMFAQYWELYEETADISEIQRFYVNIEPQQTSGGGYCNVAIIGDGLVVDIEGDDVRRSGSLSLDSIEKISSVGIHMGQLPGLPNSQNASLVVVVQRVGESDVALYWTARADDDEERLLEFARVLVQRVSRK